MGRNRDKRWDQMDKTGIDLSELIQHFELYNRSEGKSPRTVGWYNEVLGMFNSWLRTEGMPTDLGSLGEMEVRRFVLYIQNRPGLKDAKLSSHSVANRVRALRSFFAWLAKKGYTEEHLLKDLRNPKTVTRVIEPLTEEEFGRMFSAINPQTALGSRNTGLLAVMSDTGLRLGEVSSMKEIDVHFEDRYLKVIGKGSKERIVAFGVACQRALLDYYQRFRVTPANTSVDTFFLTIDGYPMSPAAIQSMMVRLAVAANVPRLYPHLLRHSYATSFLLNGGDIFLLKQNLGHSTLVMVENYLHIASRHAVVRSQSFSPLDRMRVNGDKRYRHSYPSSGLPNGGIYPNAGRKRSMRSLT